eukprot:scaffold3612_cov215-Pinguiococcus_pyrenoidosus.AAC.2
MPITEANSWWKCGCVASLVDEEGAQGFARIAYCAEDSGIRIETFGSSLLLEKVLFAVRDGLEGYPGVVIADVCLQPQCSGARETPESLHLADLLKAATEDGGEGAGDARRVLREHGIDAFGIIHAIDLHASAAAPNAQGPSSLDGSFTSTVAGAREIKYLWGKVKDRSLSKGQVATCVLVGLTRLCGIGVHDHDRLSLRAIWLVYLSPREGTHHAYPMRPRQGGA